MLAAPPPLLLKVAHESTWGVPVLELFAQRTSKARRLDDA